MEDWAGRLHHYLARGSPANLIPPWILNRAIDHLIDRDVHGGPPQRKIECYEFDPYCFAPYIDGYHGHLAYGKLGMPLLKKRLTECKDRRRIGILLNTFCSLVHDPEQAMTALKLNFVYQIRRLMTHKSWYVRQRSLLALKILAGQPSGRLQIVNDQRLMSLIIASLRDPRDCVKRITYDLIHALSQYYFAVPKLLELGFIRILMDILKENHIDRHEEIEEIEGEFEDFGEEENELEPSNSQEKRDTSRSRSRVKSEVGGSVSTRLQHSVASTVRSASKFGDNVEQRSTFEMGSGQRGEEAEAEEADELEEELGEEDDDYDDESQISQDAEEEPCALNDQSRCVLATLLDALLNLMNANADATLDAICYDAILLKCFLNHQSRNVRILTWNVFKQIFTTDVGKMALIPHNLLDQMMQSLSDEMDPQEMQEVMGTLMLALIKVENRVAAMKWGLLDRLLAQVQQFKSPSNKQLASLSVLTHLAELPGVRAQLRTKLNEIGLAVVHNDCPDVAHHIDSLIERTLWQP